jgi:hypothetical protein
VCALKPRFCQTLKIRTFWLFLVIIQPYVDLLYILSVAILTKFILASSSDRRSPYLQTYFEYEPFGVIISQVNESPGGPRVENHSVLLDDADPKLCLCEL